MKTDLTPYYLNQVIVTETAGRIIKDFEGFGIQIVFSGNQKTAYDELMAQLIPAIETLLKKNKAKLMQVLYRIDISEQKLSTEIKNFPSVPMVEIISSLIIEREMQKVITRKYFKEK